MSKIYKKLFWCALISLTVISPALQVSAEGIENPLGEIDTFEKLFAKIIQTISTLIVGLGIIAIIVSGILFLISAGDPGRLTVAKSALVFAVIGIIVGIVAGSIASEVQDVTKDAISVSAILTNIAKKAGQIVAVLSGLMIMVGGYLYLTSLGSPERVATARKAIIWAVIGTVIGILAATLVADLLTIIPL